MIDRWLVIDRANTFYTVSSSSNLETFHTSKDCHHLQESPYEVYERSRRFIEWHELPLCSRCREEMSNE